MHHPHLYGHLMVAVDVETTGTIPYYHEIVQIACVPLDEHFNPSDNYPLFYLAGIAPKYPKRQSMQAKLKTHIDAVKLSQECMSQTQAADLFDSWFVSLNLPENKRLVPLAHNWAFEKAMLQAWLGPETFSNAWDGRARDTMVMGDFVDDLHYWHGKTRPFCRVNLPHMCKRLSIPLENAHNALADCLATAKLYRETLRLFG